MIDPGVVFVLFLFGVVMLTGIAYAVLLVARWNANRVRYVEPRREWRNFETPVDRRFTPISPAETNEINSETPRRVAEIEQEKITFAETEVARALARLILAGELDLTKAVKIGTGAKSGAKYQKHSALIKEAIEQLREPPYPTLQAQQQKRWEPDKVT
jgi:hypothetical protein